MQQHLVIHFQGWRFWISTSTPPCRRRRVQTEGCQGPARRPGSKSWFKRFRISSAIPLWSHWRPCGATRCVGLTACTCYNRGQMANATLPRSPFARNIDFHDGAPMRSIAPEELERTLRTHELYVESERRSGTRADLDSTDLAGKSFAGMKLSRIHMRRADLAGADLVGADLRRAILIGAKMQRSRLAGPT